MKILVVVVYDFGGTVSIQMILTGLTRCAVPPPFVPKFCKMDKVLRYVLTKETV